jgi:membrane fusion protein, macrolide-specific efflux system
MHIPKPLLKLTQRPLWQKIVLGVAVVVVGWFTYKTFFASKQITPQYQTATAEKGTIIVSVTGSGDVSTANSAAVSTKAAGVVTALYVKDGDMVKTGDKIAEVELDLEGQQTNAQAWSSYQGAQNSLDSAKTNLYSLQSTMFGQWKSHYDLATNSTYQNADGTPNTDNRALVDFNISQDDWLAAEAKYKNQQNVVAQAQTALNSAWLTYQQSSPTIYAPISGKVTGLSLQIGSVIAGSSSSSSTTTSSTKIASIQTDAPPTISVSLTEIDVPKIKVGNRATIIFDAFPDATYTGKVVSVDTVGSVSSGVTTYPAVIRLDTASDSILSNMGATATIISQAKDDVLIVPSSSIQKQNDGTSTVRVMKNDKVSQVAVTIGLSSGTETEILSGLSSGDVVVTGTISQTSSSTGGSRTSIFGGGLGGGGARFGR